MKIKNIMKTCYLALFATAFQIYAMEDFDPIERNLLRVSSFSLESRDNIIQNDLATGVGHPAIKMKFNDGNIIKTTFNDRWELKREGAFSIENAAYVINLNDSSPPTRTQIIEHFWGGHEILHAQTYLSIEFNQSTVTTRSIMQYRFMDPSYNVDPLALRTWLNLTFQTYKQYNGVTLDSLQILAHPEHLAVFLSLLTPETEQGLQVIAAAAA